MPMEDLLTRQAPHSQEAEQSVLGSMLIDSRCISDVVGVVRPEDFYLQANREIYETMYEMFSYSEVIDPVTVLDKMRARGVYNEESSTKYLMQLMEITPTAANVKRYAQIVHDKALLRNLSEAPPASSRRSTRASARRRRFWKQRKSASMPCGAATRTSRSSTSARCC